MLDSRRGYPPHVDVLSDVLRVLRVRGALMATLDAAAPWGLDLPSRRGASFHAVVAGTCHFEVDGLDPQILAPGDLVLLPTGTRHPSPRTAGSRCGGSMTDSRPR